MIVRAVGRNVAPQEPSAARAATECVRPSALNPAITNVCDTSGTSRSQCLVLKNCLTRLMSCEPREFRALGHPESNSQIGRLPKKSPMAPDSSASYACWRTSVGVALFSFS